MTSHSPGGRALATALILLSSDLHASSAPRPEDLSFAPVFAISDNEVPSDVRSSVAHLDGAGVLDLLLVGARPGRGARLFVARGVAPGVFEPARIVDTPDLLPRAPVAADVDADGAVDGVLLTASGGLAALRGDGSGSFDAVTVADTGGDHVVAAQDADADGDLDVFVATDSGGIALGTVDADAWTIDAVDLPIQRTIIAAEDLNGDGRAELLSVDDNLELHAATVSGYGAPQVLDAFGPATAGPPDVVVADLNGDTHLDLVVVGHDAAPFVAYVGDGALGFSPADQLPSNISGPPTGERRLVDVDGDGTLDLLYSAFANGNALQPATHVSPGSGTLPFPAGRPVTAPPSDVFSSVVVFRPQERFVDVDGDGASDYLDGAEARFGPFDAAPAGTGPAGFGQATVVLDTSLLDRPRSTPRALDFDLDGDPDLVSLYQPTGVLVWQRNSGALQFERPEPVVGPDGVIVDFAVGEDPTSGTPLMAVIDESLGSRQLRVWRPAGPGGLEASPPVPTGANRLLGVADIDLDGRVEIATDRGLHELGTGFDPGPQTSVPAFDVDDDVVAFLDLDNDGDLDLVGWGSGLPTSIVVAENDTATGSFQSAVAILSPPRLPRFADMNGDGVLDVLSAATTIISFRPGGAGFTFGSPVSISLTLPPTSDLEGLGVPIDIDGDGDIDVACTPFDADLLEGQSIWLIEQNPRSFSYFVSVFSMVVVAGAGGVVDLDLDGDLDAFDLTLDGTLVLAENRLVPRAGSTFCEQTVANSSGRRGRLDAYGVPRASGTPLRLIASSLPLNTFGFILGGPQETAPVGLMDSSGTLCLGPSIGRFSRPSEIGATGSSGEISLDVAPDDLRSSAGTVLATAGLSWSFQAWHRDVGGGFGASNLTSGVTVEYR